MIERRFHGKRVFADGVKEAMVGRNCQEGRIDNLRSQLGLTELTRGRMEAGDINSFAMTLSKSIRLAVMHPLEPGISASVDKEIVVLSRCSRAGQNRDRNHQTEHGSDWSHEDFDLLATRKQSKKRRSQKIRAMRLTGVQEQIRCTRVHLLSARSW